MLVHNRELAQRLIEVREGERRALARELHDELAQHCTAIRVEAAYLRRAVDAVQVAAAAQRAADTAELLHRSDRCIEAATIILDGHLQRRRGDRQADANPGRPGLALHIRAGFLDDA